MKKVDIKRLKYNIDEIHHILGQCKNMLGEDFEVTIKKDGVSAKVKKGFKYSEDVVLTVMYAMYLLFVIENYENLDKIGKTIIDNQFESFGEMLK